MSSKTGNRKNIQAVVRIRPLNGAEIIEKARNIVSVENITKKINVRDKTGLKPFGPFDKVYDQDSTQVQIYLDVVAPLIGQVLEGYNCTVFAYGQTGAGKTYTMEGHHDETGDYSWENDPTAGIIPRALHHIFTKLEKEKPEDYSVRASYVELYNEQVFDLLSAGDQSLRVFDNKDKGVIISGMEDLPVRNRTEVYELLKRGADRRKTASTLMNITSSRSHSVFTLTVTTRQTIDNEELLRIGKIHLVDLAGSENVGRSGAVDQRAREAGNINTSLLALGRVINALTSNAAHVPYRESKLTRILQDSLGGKTITTIIAALSPASTNYEETLNTLEYVQRAKNIKNNPTANACLSKRQVLLAYDEEIARLQRDLVAARCGGGFYVDKENYDAMQIEASENRSRIEDLEADLASKLSDLSNFMHDLQYMDDNYKLAYERLKVQSERYARGIREQENLKMELNEVSDRYHSALDALDIYQDIAERLRNKEKMHKENAVVLYDELSIIQDKVEYFRNLMSDNDHLLGNFTAKRITSIHEAKDSITEFVQDSSSNMEKMTEQNNILKSTVASDLNAIHLVGEKAAILLKEVCSLVNSISTQAKNSSNLLETASSTIESGINTETQLVEDFSSKLTHHLEEGQRSLEHFTHQEIKREERTGGTPDRRDINISSIQTLSPIPTRLELLKETARTPARASTFRIRDSLLEKDMIPSPNTLKSSRGVHNPDS